MPENPKTPLKDPKNYLHSWDFNNSSEGLICEFTGIGCWKPGENRVLIIRLSNMGLQGQFPPALNYCTSMTGFDLSNNNLTGSLPLNIDKIIRFVVKLDLSSNNFSGKLPSLLGNLTYLNELNLEHNRFTGQIRRLLTGLSRLKTFSVADNSLSGQIPIFTSESFPASSFANNPGLCGTPLGDCKNSHVGISVEAAVGAAVGGAIVGILFVVCLLFCCRRTNKEDEAPVAKEEGIERNNWLFSTSEKSVAKMRLHDLRKATNNFSDENLIDSGRNGNVYKATLSNGSITSVKRLLSTQQARAEFISEMTTLGKVQHRNLVSLNGFCIARKERLLVYEYLPKRTLYQKLHQAGANDRIMEWPFRLKIALGVARGLSWLHHNCNPCTVHCNISSKCIIWDQDSEPRISDFGSARLMNPLDAHLTTFVNGRYGNMGYVAPEYTRMLVATRKGDVYSFGILLLELITGKVPTQVADPPHNFKQNLVEWIIYLSVNSLLLDAADKSLTGSCNDELLECLKVATACVASFPEERPTMLQVYQNISDISSRYGFSAENEMSVPPGNHDDNSNVQIVSQEIQEIHEMYE